MVAISVIMPAYNEAASIAASVEDVEQGVFSVVEDGELIVIDDGSTDQTGVLLDELASKYPRLRVIHQANAGHGPSLIRGVAEARGETVLLLDSDRQIKLDGFGEHWRRMGREDLVAFLGVRTPRHDAAHRLVISRLMRVLIHLCFGQAPRDAGAPYKIVRRSQWNEATESIAKDSWVPSVLLAVFLLRRYRDRTVEEAVTHLARDQGESTLNFTRLTRFCRKATTEIFAFRRALNRGSR